MASNGFSQGVGIAFGCVFGIFAMCAIGGFVMCAPFAGRGSSPSVEAVPDNRTGSGIGSMNSAPQVSEMDRAINDLTAQYQVAGATVLGAYWGEGPFTTEQFRVPFTGGGNQLVLIVWSSGLVDEFDFTIHQQGYRPIKVGARPLGTIRARQYGARKLALEPGQYAFEVHPDSEWRMVVLQLPSGK